MAMSFWSAVIFILIINSFLAPVNGWFTKEPRKIRHRRFRRSVLQQGEKNESPNHEVASDTTLNGSAPKELDTQAFKSLLKDLLARLDSFDETSAGSPPGGDKARLSKRHINSLKHCSLRGLWLSTVAGAAIELIPENIDGHGHVEIHTKIFELPDNPYPPLLTSRWTGKGIISQESPTTLTIVFQEHIDGGKQNQAKERDNGVGDNSPVEIQLPRTAVFVGQCLVCHGSPMLQGSWVVFPASQTCGIGFGFSPEGNSLARNEQEGFVPNDSRRPDAIYLLERY